MASALLPSTKLNRAARLARLATALAAMGLVFMGAIVVPVYLVPALTGVLAVGLVAERHAEASAGRLRVAVTEMIPPRPALSVSGCRVLPGRSRSGVTLHFAAIQDQNRPVL